MIWRDFCNSSYRSLFTPILVHLAEHFVLLAHISNGICLSTFMIYRSVPYFSWCQFRFDSKAREIFTQWYEKPWFFVWFRLSLKLPLHILKSWKNALCVLSAHTHQNSEVRKDVNKVYLTTDALLESVRVL